VVSSTHSQKMI